MTKEELEKGAEEGLNRRIGTIGYNCRQNCQKPYTDGFQDGATFGYNKATKWHKVADGDLPSIHATFLNEKCEKVEYVGKGKWEAYSEYYEEYVEVEPPIAWCVKPTFEE